MGVLTGLNLGVTHDHVDPQAVVQHPAIVLRPGVDGSHALGQLVLGFGPHQIDIAVGGAQVNGLRRVTAKVQQGAAGLVGAHRVGRQALELVNLALVVDLVLRPGLFEDFHHLQ